MLTLVAQNIEITSDITAGVLITPTAWQHGWVPYPPVAGSRTYGKGLIQSVYELSDGSGLVLTVGPAPKARARGDGGATSPRGGQWPKALGSNARCTLSCSLA